MKMRPLLPRFVALLIVLETPFSIQPADFRVGAAAVDITPPSGTPMAGYYHSRAAEGVHDPLHSKAITIERDGAAVALVALDLISTQRGFVEEARRRIEEQTGIPGAHVMISATHAHTGPVLSGRSSRTAALGGEEGRATTYIEDLPRLIAQSVQRARAEAKPSRISVAVGQEPTLAFNRRFHMTDGTVGWNPGRLNPKILRPAGPIDPEVPVIVFESPDGEPFATYVNYAMHLDTVGGRQISADYPYTLDRLLKEVRGEQLVNVFTIGTAGDINHINVRWKEQPKGHSEAARIGTVLAGAVIRTFPELNSIAPGPIQVLSEMVPLPLPPVTESDLEAARETVKQLARPQAQRPPFLEQVRAFQVLDVYARQDEPHSVEVQVITIGEEIAWVSLPGEIFVELGLAIKQASPFPVTVIAELANGSIGYIPTRQAYTQGNYEVVSARCAAGSGELLVEAASRLLRQAHQQSIRALSASR